MGTHRTRRGSGWTLIPALFLLASCRGGRPPAPQAGSGASTLRPLNLVVVTVDTLRPDHLGCYGYSKIETPNLDALARGGALFENAVAQAPLTPPSHASIFTGQYPPTHHVRNTGGFVLQSSSTTLAEMLQAQGWDTAAFVSSIVLKKLFGFNQGFAVYDDQMPAPGNRLEFREEPERRADATVDRALQWLDRQSGKPYFLWVHLYDPHLPYRPPEPFARRYRERPYDGEIAWTDQQLGRLFAAVRKKAGGQNTIVAVLSDHGESLEDHGEYTHGVFVYDSTLRIAFLLAGPGVPAGLRVKQQVRSIDFLPTVLNLMGGQAPASVQGTSLTPTFSGKTAPTAVSYAETLYPKLAMGWSELRAIRTDRWKYIQAPKPELYDLTNDPHETRNVIRQNPAVVERLQAHMRSITGNDGKEKVATRMLDDRTMAQLRSLGYLQGFSPLSYDLNGQGVDPKDRLEVLKMLELAESRESQIPEARRIGLLEQAMSEDATNPSLYYQLGAEYEKTGRYADAMKLYRSALQRGVENGRLHSRLGDLLLRAGNKDEAITEYEQAARFNPADTESQINLATAYLEKGRAADAERVFKWIVTTDDTSAAAYNGLGLIAIQRQDTASARGYFEKAVQLDPDLVEAQLNLGLIYRMAGDAPHARACFEAFLAKAPRAQYGDMIPKVKEAIAGLR